MPVAGARISCAILFVSVDFDDGLADGDWIAHGHRPTYKIKTPAIFGTFISVPIFSSFLRRLHPKENNDGPRSAYPGNEKIPAHDREGKSRD
jgi:hypothetical protein